MPFAIEPMQLEDIPQVVTIEEACFTMPWPASAYKRELKNPRSTRYLIIRDYTTSSTNSNTITQDAADAGHDERKPFLSTLLPFLFNNAPEKNKNPYPIVGYAGLWLMMDEAHITSIAVLPKYRGRNLGELLLVGLTDVAIQMGASWLTLEVRVSNVVAQNLYKKYTFKEAGVRKHYYTDNNEDAYIMWSEEITKQGFQDKYAQLKKELFEKLANKGDLAATDSTVPLVEIQPIPAGQDNPDESESDLD